MQQQNSLERTHALIQKERMEAAWLSDQNDDAETLRHRCSIFAGLLKLACANFLNRVMTDHDRMR